MDKGEKQYICSYEGFIIPSFFILSPLPEHLEIQGFITSRNCIECYTSFTECKKALIEAQDVFQRIAQGCENEERFLCCGSHLETLFIIIQEHLRDKTLYRKGGKKSIDGQRSTSSLIQRRIFHTDEFDKGYRQMRNTFS